MDINKFQNNRLNSKRLEIEFELLKNEYSNLAKINYLNNKCLMLAYKFKLEQISSILDKIKKDNLELHQDDNINSLGYLKYDYCKKIQKIEIFSDRYCYY